MFLIHSSTFKTIPIIISVTPSLSEVSTQSAAERHLVLAVWPEAAKSANAKPVLPLMA